MAGKSTPNTDMESEVVVSLLAAGSIRRRFAVDLPVLTRTPFADRRRPARFADLLAAAGRKFQPSKATRSDVNMLRLRFARRRVRKQSVWRGMQAPTRRARTGTFSLPGEEVTAPAARRHGSCVSCLRRQLPTISGPRSSLLAHCWRQRANIFRAPCGQSMTPVSTRKVFRL